MMGLTAKQREAFDLIAACLRENGVAPTIGEIGVAMHFKSKTQAYQLVQILEERGYIRRLPHRARAIEIIPQDGPADAVRLHPEVRAAAIEYAHRHGVTLSTALGEACRAYFVEAA